MCSEALVGSAAVEIAVDEIGDDFDGMLDVKFFDRLLEQIVRDAGDAVALLDGKFGDGKIAAVAADEGDVRAMKRGDEGKAARRGHGTREQRADRMGNGVVNVEKVEGFGFENFEHFGGESEGVGRMVEEGVGDDLHFVKVDALAIGIHADGRGVADEMNVVTASGELHAQLGGDDAGAAVGGVASDANAHRVRFESPLNGSRYDTTNSSAARDHKRKARV